jgi:hypothetical protein
LLALPIPRNRTGRAVGEAGKTDSALGTKGPAVEPWEALQIKFGTGIRLPELRSVAALVCHLTGVARPSRDTNLSYPLMANWFADNWGAVATWINVIELIDADGKAITGEREREDLSFFTDP